MGTENIKNLKFTASIYMPRLDILDEKDSNSKAIDCKSNKNVGNKVLKVYEQLPIICEDIHLSITIDPKTGEIINQACGILEDYNRKAANLELDADDFYIHYKPGLGEIRYGYEYIKNGIQYKSSLFTTQQERDETCLLETGIDFESIDYSNKLNTYKQNNPQFLKK